MFNTKAIAVGASIGAPIGLTISYFAFNNIGWYHNYLLWQFQHPLVLIPAAGVGVLLGTLTD
jgi:hypothetical protein